MGTSVAFTSSGEMQGFGITKRTLHDLYRGFLNRSDNTPEIHDIQVQNAQYGIPITKTFGRMRVAGNVIWYKDPVFVKNEQPELSQGKGNSARVSHDQYYNAYGNFAIGLCKGVVGLSKLWINGKLYQNVSDFVGDLSEEETLSRYAYEIESDDNSNTSIKYRFYTGSETQLQDPLIAQNEGIASTPAFRDIAYIVIEDFPFREYDNTMPTFEAEVTFNPTPIVGKRLWSSNTFAVIEGLNNWSYTDVEFSSSLIGTRNARFLGGSFRRSVNLSNNAGGGIYGTSYDFIRREFWQVNPILGFWQTFGYVLSSTKNKRFSLLAIGDANQQLSHVSAPKLYPYFADAFNTAIDISNPATYLSKSHPDILPKIITNSNLYVGAIIQAKRFNQRDENHLLVFSMNTRTPLNNTNPFVNYFICQISDQGEPIIIKTGDASSLTYFTNLPNPVHSGSGTYSQRSPYSINFNINAQDDSDNGFKIGCLESNLEYLWLADSAVGKVSCLQLNADNTISRLFDLDLDNPGVKNGGMACDNGLCYITHDFIPSVNGGFRRLTAYTRLQTFQSTTPTLANIVTDLSTNVGLGLGDIDTSQLINTASGAGFGRQSKSRAILDQFANFYEFELVESEYQIKFIKKDAGSAITIPESDLSAFRESSNKNSERVIITRKLETQIPQKVNVRYIRDGDTYEQDSQHFEVINSIANNELEIEAPISLNPIIAKRLAEKILISERKARENYKISVPIKYILLDAGDVILFNKGSRQFKARITKVEITRELVINIEAEAYDNYTYSSTSTSFAPTVPLRYGITVKGGTIPTVFDSPQLVDGDTDLGFYAGVSGFYDAWDGGVLMESDGDDDFKESASFTSQIKLGRLFNSVSNNPSPNIRDLETQLIIQPDPNMTLESITELQFLKNKNVALLGNEILGFKNAVLQADGTYLLTELNRGLKGTEIFISPHNAGERFILLTGGSTIRRIKLDASQLGNTKLFRGVTFGKDIENFSEQKLKIEGNSLKPYAVAHVQGTRNVGNDLNITWVPRTRSGGEWRDFVENYNIDPDNYSIDILDPTQTNVVRTLTATSRNVTYTSAQQVTDGYTPPQTVFGRIYHINDIVGRGRQKDFAL